MNGPVVRLATSREVHLDRSREGRTEATEGHMSATVLGVRARSSRRPGTSCSRPLGPTTRHPSASPAVPAPPAGCTPPSCRTRETPAPRPRVSRGQASGRVTGPGSTRTFMVNSLRRSTHGTGGEVVEVGSGSNGPYGRADASSTRRAGWSSPLFTLVAYDRLRT